MGSAIDSHSLRLQSLGVKHNSHFKRRACRQETRLLEGFARERVIGSCGIPRKVEADQAIVSLVRQVKTNRDKAVSASLKPESGRMAEIKCTEVLTSMILDWSTLFLAVWSISKRSAGSSFGSERSPPDYRSLKSGSHQPCALTG